VRVTFLRELRAGELTSFDGQYCDRKQIGASVSAVVLTV